MTLPELESYFNSIELPKQLQLNKWTLITDVRAYIDVNISFCKNAINDKMFKLKLEKLVELYKKLENGAK